MQEMDQLQRHDGEDYGKEEITQARSATLEKSRSAVPIDRRREMKLRLDPLSIIGAATLAYLACKAIGILLFAHGFS